MKEIAILTGGYSEESKISLCSARVVFENLDKKKYNCTIVEITKKEWTAKIEGNKKIEIDKKNFSFIYKNCNKRFDFIFIALHGPPAENGEIQPYFEKLNLPYSSCDSRTSSLTFNKIKCNKVLSKLGFRCANSIKHKKGDKINLKLIIKKIGLPCFIKPSQSGSSLGISKVTESNQINKAINFSLKYYKEVIIEEFINGTELSCGVLMIKNKITTLPLTEIISQNDFFDYQAKYHGLSEEITPARINKESTKLVRKITKEVYQKMNLQGLCRIDFILRNAIPYIIEINTIPGLSEESIVPKQAKEADISLSELFNICIENTMNK